MLGFKVYGTENFVIFAIPPAVWPQNVPVRLSQAQNEYKVAKSLYFVYAYFQCVNNFINKKAIAYFWGYIVNCVFNFYENEIT